MLLPNRMFKIIVKHTDTYSIRIISTFNSQSIFVLFNVIYEILVNNSKINCFLLVKPFYVKHL